MSGKLLAKSNIKIQAPVGKVWQALTDPASNEKALAHMEKNWNTVLEVMKNLLEKK